MLSVSDNTTLRDAWLRADIPSAIPAYSFYQRRVEHEETKATLEQLKEELVVLSEERIERATSAEASQSALGLRAWQQHVEYFLETPDASRSLARADVAYLVAHPRDNPTLSDIHHFGYCEPPDWVELWHAGGVEKMAYQPDMTLGDALEALPARDTNLSDYVTWVSPGGQYFRLGVAAWNHQQVDLVPGGRIVVPLSESTPSAEWVNYTLPHILAKRLPGSECKRFMPTKPLASSS